MVFEGREGGAQEVRVRGKGAVHECIEGIDVCVYDML